MGNEASTQRSAPAIVGWAAAIISALLLYVVIRTIVVTFGEVRELVAYQSLRETLAISNYYESETKLDQLFSNVALYNWFTQSDSSVGTRKDEERKETLRDYHQVIRLLSQDDFKSALVLFNTLREGRLHRLLDMMPPNSQNTALLSDIEDEFKDYQEQLDLLAKLKNEVPLTLEENQRRIKSQSLLAMDLANDFGRLLSLQAEEPDPSTGAMTFYDGGVLKDLPKLQGLKDDIGDLIELKAQLDALGGGVEIHGQNAPKIFQTKIDKMKESGQIHRTTLESIMDQSNTLSQTLSNLKQSVLKTGTVLEANLKAFLLEAARPDVGTPSKVVASGVFGTPI